MRGALKGGRFPSRGIGSRQSRRLSAVAIEALEERRMFTLHPLTAIPALESLPGATASIYLDFDGHFQDQWWIKTDIAIPAFDRDSDDTTFSDDELAFIEEIWRYVAEDYAPFNINVTTIEPPSFADRTGLRVAIGGDGAWYGVGGVVGVAQYDAYTSSGIPNLVFAWGTPNSTPHQFGNIASHEAGHAFGLAHYAWPQNFPDRWAIMYEDMNPAGRFTWWEGSSDFGFQDDMERISHTWNGFGYRPDDHGNSAGGASPLDSVGQLLTGSGIIEQTDDKDYFAFSVDDGAIIVDVSVPVPYANLDSRLEIRDATDTIVASFDLADRLDSHLNLQLPAGDYYAVVASAGVYGDVGAYELSIQLIPASIQGIAYLDHDYDGVRDIGEPVLSDALVYDDRNNNGVFDSASLQLSLESTDVPQSTAGVVDASSSLFVSLPGTITDINVTVSTDDAFTGLTLIAPDGTAIPLNPAGTGVFTDTTFDDEASNDLSLGSSPYTSSFIPISPLSTFDGRDPNGEWKLTAIEISGTVTILDWSLEITTTGEHSMFTNGDGEYFFAFDDTETHHIRQVDEPGYVQTGPTGGVYAVTNVPGTPDTGNDFGNAPPAVLNRALFYNNSSFDGNNTAINSSDDAAIATDKVAYLPGDGLTVFNSLSTYSGGINGIMIDVAGLAGSISASDFIFRVGANNDPSSWSAAPSPSAVSVRAGAGVNGWDRIEITWADGAIKNTWLQVILEGDDATGGNNTNTGLAASDTFFFGSRVGETGTGTSTVFLTSAADTIAIRNNYTGSAAVTNIYDMDRDGDVDVDDETVAQSNSGLTYKIEIEPEGMMMAAMATNGGDENIIVSGLQQQPQSHPQPIRLASLAERFESVEAFRNRLAEYRQLVTARAILSLLDGDGDAPEENDGLGDAFFEVEGRQLLA